MITCKMIRSGEEGVMQFESISEGTAHFGMFSKGCALSGDVKVQVFSISRTAVMLLENTPFGEGSMTYSGSEEEMTIIVVLAARLLCEEKAHKAGKMINEMG